MFLYSLESKFHDLFKTHLTFIFKSLLRDPGSFKVKKQIFEWTPSSAHIMAPKTLRSIFYQMEHIWWAPSRLKNSKRFTMRSQLNHTLYRSFIVTLYIVWKDPISLHRLNWWDWRPYILVARDSPVLMAARAVVFSSHSRHTSRM